MNELTGFEQTVNDLRAMLETTLEVQSEVLPVYRTMSKTILEMINKEEEIAHWEPKDLLKLLDLANKAQLAPIEQLTKLVHALSSLYQRTELEKKIETVTQIANQLKGSKNDLEDTDDFPEILDV